MKNRSSFTCGLTAAFVLLSPLVGYQLGAQEKNQEKEKVLSPSFRAGQASAKQIEQFKASPKSFIAGFPIGGAQLSSLIKALVLAETGLSETVLAAMDGANAQQKAAIGAGLAQAAKIITSTDKALADKIAEAVAKNGSPDILAGYSAAQADIQTLAVSSAAGTSIGGSGAGGGGAGTTSSAASLGGSGKVYDGFGSLYAAQSTSSSLTSLSSSLSGAVVSCTTSASPTVYRC